MTKRLAIIDGKSVFYRGYYAMPNLSTADGTPTGGVYGFTALSLELLKRLKPDYVCVAWDKPKTNIRKRREIYPEYKAGRKPAPPDFYAQVPVLHELLEVLGWPLYELDDYEADDIMGTLSHQASEAGIETCLISSDLDMLQCIDENTHMYALKKGFSQIDLYEPESFEKKYGIRVDQFLDLKSLKGDASDNIPGVPGIGEKGAVKLLQQYETLDAIYDHIDEITGSTNKKLVEGKDSAYVSKQIAALMFDAPLELDLGRMDITKLDTAKLRDMLKKLEFTSLLRALPESMRSDSVEELARSAAEPMELVDWNTTEHTQALMADYVLVQFVGDTLYVSHDGKHASAVALQDIAELAQHAAIVTHDGGGLCHRLLDAGLIVPDTLYDIRQAGFLINPLKKSHTAAQVTGYDGEDDLTMLAELWRVYIIQLQELDKLPKVKELAYQMDFPLIPILARMEHQGIRLDTAQLDKMNTKITQELAGIKDTMHAMAGKDFNIASPSQLAEVLFTDLELPVAGIKKGKTGYSTGQKELDKLRGKHPIIELIEQYRELSKLQNTYVEALPRLVDEHSRLHTTFNQDVAATGRLSSTDPNLQNIPVRTEQGRKIRQAFVPAKGNVFVSADYSQFELRLAAVLAGDKQMISDFNAGIDIHAKTAADVQGVPLEEVTKDQRRAAKVINFGVLYGMSPHGLAAAADMTFIEAKDYIDQYFALRAPVREYIDATIRHAREQGFVETYYGRRRPTPDVQSSNFMVRSGAERAAANMPIQGTEADLMKMAMIEVEKALQSVDERLNASAAPNVHGVQNVEKNDILPAESRAPLESGTAEASRAPLGAQILQIHDSILVECPAGNAEAVGQLLKTTMESIAPELGIKLDVDVTIGSNWGEV